MSNQTNGMGVEDRAAALAHQHAHRAPSPDAVQTIRDLRQRCYDLALFIESACKPGREKALAQTKLDEVRMWACNALTMDGTISEPL